MHENDVKVGQKVRYAYDKKFGVGVIKSLDVPGQPGWIGVEFERKTGSGFWKEFGAKKGYGWLCFPSSLTLVKEPKNIKRWTVEEEKFLINYRGAYPVSFFVEVLERSKSSIISKAAYLGISLRMFK